MRERTLSRLYNLAVIGAAAAVLGGTPIALAAVPGLLGVSFTSPGGGDVASSEMPDPFTVPDGTWNVTGDVSASGFRNAAGKITLTPASTEGVKIATLGVKATCNASSAGSLFYENTAGDSTASVLYLCVETATANTYEWWTVDLTDPTP